MADYQLKLPPVYDWYEGEAPIRFDRMDIVPPLQLFRYSAQFGDGTRRADHMAEEYVAECKLRGMNYGGYHFLREHGIAEQAALYLDMVDKCGLGACGHPIVDVEIDNEAFRGVNWAYQVKTFIDIVERETGKKPIIYTTRYYWAYLNDHSGNPPAWTKDYLLWLAYWPTYPDDFPQPTKAMLPNGFTVEQVCIWQYKDNGRSNGYLANDLNILTDWYAAEIGTSVPPEPPEPPGETMRAKITADGLNFRKTPAGEWLASYPKGTAVEVSEIVTTSSGDKWAHTTSPIVAYCANWFLEYETTPPPPVGGKHNVKVVIDDVTVTDYDFE